MIAGVFDLDTPQGIVATIFGGPIGWIAAWIQESEEEIEATVKGRLSEWWSKRQQVGEMPLIIW